MLMFLPFAQVALVMNGVLILLARIMCPNKVWFTSYHSIDGGKVLMGNIVACNVIGSVRYKSKCIMDCKDFDLCATCL